MFFSSGYLVAYCVYFSNIRFRVPLGGPQVNSHMNSFWLSSMDVAGLIRGFPFSTSCSLVLEDVPWFGFCPIEFFYWVYSFFRVFLIVADFL